MRERKNKYGSIVAQCKKEKTAQVSNSVAGSTNSGKSMFSFLSVLVSIFGFITGVIGILLFTGAYGRKTNINFGWPFTGYMPTSVKDVTSQLSNAMQIPSGAMSLLQDDPYPCPEDIMKRCKAGGFDWCWVFAKVPHHWFWNCATDNNSGKQDILDSQYCCEK